MKTLKRISALVLLLALSIGVKAQQNENEKLYLPGDNLNLYAVMNLFQESETLEGFERKLNAADAKINNLDLNGDNLIDYIKVIDYVEGTTHTIVLQVAINERENQDVAVFTVFRDKHDEVHIQLVGDEYLYGKDYIIEPYYAETPNPGYTGNTRVVSNQPIVVRTTYIEVRTWPVVRYIYTPTYVVYRSPWYWNYYPVYWNPWRPYYWDYYYGYHSHWHHHYYSHYRHTRHYHKNYYVNNYFYGHRNYSNTVRTYESNGRYKDTYTRPDLRSKGADEGQRVYASAMRNAGRTDGQKPGRVSRKTNQRKVTEGTPSVGRTSAPGAGRSSADVSTRRSAPRGSAVPSIGRESGKTKSVQRTVRSNKSEVRSTTPKKQRADVNPPKRQVRTQKAQSPARSAKKPAVRSSDNRSSKSGQYVGSSSSRSSQPANRNASSQKKSGTSRKSSGSGR